MAGARVYKHVYEVSANGAVRGAYWRRGNAVAEARRLLRKSLRWNLGYTSVEIREYRTSLSETTRITADDLDA